MDQRPEPDAPTAEPKPTGRRSAHGPRLAGLVAIWLVLFGPAAPAQPPAESPPKEPGAVLDRAEAESQRDALAERIAALRAGGEESAPTLTLLERQERLLSRHLNEIARGEELALQLGEAERTAALPPSEAIGHDPPYSVAEYDAALEELGSAGHVLAGLEEALVEAREALEAAREATDAAERERRAARSGAEPMPERVELESRVARTELSLRRLQAENASLAVEVQERRLARRRADVGWLEGRVVPEPGELDARLAELDTQAAQLTRRREQVELQVEAAERRWRQADSRLPSDPAAEAEVAARRAELVALQKRVGLLGEQLERLERARALLPQRFRALAPEPPARAELARWREESHTARQALERETRLEEAEQAAIEQELRALEGGLGAGAERAWQERQAQALRDTIAAHQESLASLEVGRARELALLQTLDRQLGSVSAIERLQQLTGWAWKVWSFEVASSEDRSITVGRIVVGALAFLVGLMLARAFTHWAAPRIFSHTRVDEGAAHAYQSLAYYALLAVAFITALRIVDIPLTAFAVVGGALAIGVGFGSQNIVNNFISGVILLSERPIKRGDLVEVDGTYGNVERIGLRSTRVRTGDNIHVIVPNSAFLENNVINWTHNDRKVRIAVSVGVVYGSPTREVSERIARAVREHPQVLEQPEPIVLFRNFGDNALEFEVRFWVMIRNLLGRLRIESDVRFRIDDLLREAGIVIAFPQRDVHVDAQTPIPVRLIEAGDDETVAP